MVNKNWTFEEAQAADQAALDADPSLPRIYPGSPFFKWLALHQLDWFEEAYEEDRSYLMRAIRVCANHDLPLPLWAAMAFIEGHDKIMNARSGSWDEVFALPYPKKHVSKVRQQLTLGWRILHEVRLIRQMNPDRSIGDGLFEEVGAKFGISKTTASKYYYSCPAVKLIAMNKRKNKQSNKA